MWPDSQETQELMRAAQGKEPVAVNRLLDRHREALQLVEHRIDVGQLVDPQRPQRLPAVAALEERA